VSRSLKAHILLVMVTLVWGATFVLIKSALEDVEPLLFNALRMTLAAVCLGAFFWKDIARIELATFFSGARVGVFLWLGYELQTSGLRLTTPSKSGFLTGLSVVLVSVFLALFWGKRTNVWTSIGVVAALFGLVLMTVPSGSGFADFSSVNTGDIFTLGCAVAFAFQIIFTGTATKAHGFERIAFLQMAVATALMWPTLALVGKPHYILWSGRVIWALLITGILCTAVAFTVQSWAQQFTPPTHTALIFALEPVFAWLTSWIVLGERLGWRAGAGATLILAGVLISELFGTLSEPSTQPSAVELSVK
jgi:drug/metabolite transporter (DMT)-like permease